MDILLKIEAKINPNKTLTMIAYQYHQPVESVTTKVICSTTARARFQGSEFGISQPLQGNYGENIGIWQILQQNYGKMDTAFIKANVAEFDFFFSENYLKIDADQKRGAVYGNFSSPAGLRGLGTNLQWISRKTMIKSVTMKSNIAEALVLHHDVKMVTKRFRVDMIARHIWIKTSQGWRLDQQTTLSTKSYECEK